MSLAYPIAKTARAALSAKLVARSKEEALRLSGKDISALETEWLTPAAKDVSKLIASAESTEAKGFLQHYEDTSGNTVLAVTYWKLAARKTKPVTPKPPQKPVTREDHTDDLYFRRSKKPRKAKPVDPNQMALFDLPKDESSGS